MKTYFLFISMVLLVVSCEQKDDLQTITIGNEYSIALPSSLSKAENLNTEASLQYQNIFRELYVIVLDEPKKEVDSYLESTSSASGLNGYAKLLKNNFKEALEKPTFSEPKNSQINGLKAQLHSVSATVEASEIYYELAYIEGKSNYYQVLVWTVYDQKENHIEEMKEIISSFKELKSRGLRKRLPK